MKSLFFVIFLIFLDGKLAVDKISDFDERDDEENFLAKLEKFKQERRKAMKELRDVSKNKPEADESAFPWNSLEKRYVTAIKPNKIRLSINDSLPKENATGRVEIYHNNQWGTVCGRSWDLEDAFVVCSELGMVKAIFESRNAKYGRGDGLPIWLSKVNCVGEESSLADCPHPGWGNVGSCTHGNDAGVKCLETGVPQIVEVGCYKDSSSNRALRSFIQNKRYRIDWYNLRSVVTKCAERAWQLGFRYFGIQYYAECWSDREAESRYNMHGPVDPLHDTQNCREGTGMNWANYVYKFAPWKDLGCWKDKINDRAVPYLLVNYRGHIDWLNIGRIINKCYEAAKQAGKEYFAVQFYGECWVADDGTTYQKHGPSISCWSGVGKGHTNYVYKIEW